MHFFGVTIATNVFRLNEMQISKVTYDDFSDGETQGLRVYIYNIIYIIYIIYNI